MKTIRVGILGASTLLAGELLSWMEKWHFHFDGLLLFDDLNYRGLIKACKGNYYPIQEESCEKIASVDILFVAKEGIDEESCSRLGTYTIDLRNLSIAKNIYPHVNIASFQKELTYMHIANPSTYALVNVLQVMHHISTVNSVNYDALCPVSSRGEAGCRELTQQMAQYLGKLELEAKQFPLPSSTQHLPILFQALPQTSAFMEGKITEEEQAVKDELQLLFGEDIRVYGTCMQAPFLRGIAISITLTLQEEIDADRIMDAFTSSPSFICIADEEHDMYPIISDVIHDYRIFIGRIRQEGRIVQLWCVMDDLSARCAAAMQVGFYLLHNVYGIGNQLFDNVS